MRAHFGLPSVKSEQDVEKRAPITVKFEIPYFTVSGIQVRYLKVVEKSGYQALPWVGTLLRTGTTIVCEPHSIKAVPLSFQCNPITVVAHEKGQMSKGRSLHTTLTLLARRTRLR
ncbi:hypothetical protein EDB83DRAFT_1536609 [Lactarius deliciosus]|nr:hypothetical protein EDB83DRAFT_1536609 [Lactarius deliciosus]